MLEQCCQRFWHNYVAAKDALRVFLSMRIKRLLKFIDITDSIKLCPSLSAAQRARIACLCSDDFFFLVVFQLPFQRIFYAVFCEWRGNGSKFSMSSMAATDDWQQNWQCQKQQWWRRQRSGDVNCDGSSSSSSDSDIRPSCAAVRRGEWVGTRRKLNLREKYF